MSIAAIATEIHEATGLEGAELEVRTHFIATLFADACGDKAIGDYFQRRMRDAHERAKKPVPAFKYGQPKRRRKGA